MYHIGLFEEDLGRAVAMTFFVLKIKSARCAIADNEIEEHRKTKDELVGQICNDVDAFISHFVKINHDQ